MESKLITPKYITGTYFGAIVAIFNSIFSVCFLCVMLFLTPERAPKAGPATCFVFWKEIHLEKKYQLYSFLFRKEVLGSHYIYGQPKNDTPMTDRVYGQIS